MFQFVNFYSNHIQSIQIIKIIKSQSLFINSIIIINLIIVGQQLIRN